MPRTITLPFLGECEMSLKADTTVATPAHSIGYGMQRHEVVVEDRIKEIISSYIVNIRALNDVKINGVYYRISVEVHLRKTGPEVYFGASHALTPKAREKLNSNGDLLIEMAAAAVSSLDALKDEAQAEFLRAYAERWMWVLKNGLAGIRAAGGPPLRLFLDISTAHLTEETREKINAGVGPTRYEHPDGYGWMVHVPESDDDIAGATGGSGVMADLEACLARARALGADYIMFDSDGPVDQELPTYA